MTADAKVGLLLGLFFIVVIAFLINGLPNFLQTTTPQEEAKTALVAPSGPDLVIDRRITETAQRLVPGIPLRVTEPPQDVIVLNQTLPQSQMQMPLQTQMQPQMQTLLPSVVESPVLPQPEASPVVEEPVLSPSPRPMPEPSVAVAAASTTAHVVQKGETLAVIAQKYYGPEEGNRRAVIQKLYEANKDVLSSPDKVVVGNKLTIPSLPGSTPKTPSPSESLLKKFTNVFERTDTPAKTTAQPKPKTAAQPKAALQPVKTDRPAAKPKTKEYIVQPGDTLWKIAEKTIGDGRQFNTLVQLNKDRLKNADDVIVGMKIVVPAP